MNVFETIETRHSYRGGFKPTPIPRTALRRIVEAGIRAPSGCNAQTTSFVIVDDPELLTAIAAVMDKQVFTEARAVIVCIVDHKPVFFDMAFGPEDCAAAVENMLLAITSLGYATVWTDGALRREGCAGKIAALLGVPEHLQVRVILPLGIPREEVAQKEKKPFRERAWFNAYGKSE